MSKPKTIKLTQLNTGDEAIIDHWIESKNLSLEHIQMLRAMGICPQSKLKVNNTGKPCKICKVSGPCIISIENTRIAVAREVAEQLIVEPIPPK